ncbi:leghemoglobin Lb120-1-like [Lathyrus oleraceus]|uniref:leghemoglobin Lb120-1-like n=1 Tax=Pisum sativum TaxID=3888 RepID=UPI0021D23E5B|nr:leghemoglobin Lb120-1-like [Pisum sativum]
MGFTEKQEALVNSSWELFKQNPSYSVLFYTVILKKEPATKGMFSFLKDSAEVVDSPKLQAHTEKVFGMVTVIRIQYYSTLSITLSVIHIQKGVVDPHFVMIKKVLLETVTEASGDK